MEVSALKYSGGIGRPSRSPLTRLQSDEHLIKMIRAGHDAGFEVLLARYESRLLSFCRHLLGSREDAEDVLQEVFSAAYNALHADERAINVRPWLYRIARNRCLNHMRRTQAIGLDSMDVLLAANGESTADKVHQREEFRLLVGDIHSLPESQRTALILRELDALTYEQIAETMETTVSSVKSLLVRARVSLAETAEARLLTCAEVRIELGELAEGLVKRNNPLVRRHLKTCDRCSAFSKQLKRTNRALAGLMPIGPFAVWKTGLLSHLPGHAGGGAAAAGSSAAGTSSGVASGALAGTAASSSGFLGAGAGALATKAAAGLAIAAVLAAAGMSNGASSRSGQPSVRPAPSALATAAGPGVGSTHRVAAKHSTGRALSGRTGQQAHLHTAATTDQPLRSTGASSAVHQLTSTSSGVSGLSTSPAPASAGTAAPTSASGATTTAPTSSASSTPATRGPSSAGSSSPSYSTAAGAASAAASAVGTLASQLGASLGGSGAGGSTQNNPSTATITVPDLIPPAASGSGSATHTPSLTDPGTGTATTAAPATPAA